MIIHVCVSVCVCSVPRIYTNRTVTSARSTRYTHLHKHHYSPQYTSLWTVKGILILTSSQWFRRWLWFQGRCYAGECKMRDTQCKYVWGPSESSLPVNIDGQSGVTCKVHKPMCISLSLFTQRQRALRSSVLRSWTQKVQKRATAVRTERSGSSAVSSEFNTKLDSWVLVLSRDVGWSPGRTSPVAL